MAERIDATTMRDGRTIAYNLYGKRNGLPIFLLHGSPGCRLGPVLRNPLLLRMGLCLICPDRSGYGESDPNPSRSVADYAWDVVSIADQLGLETFSVLGRSGGGPHALACAALLGERVTRVATMSCLAPLANQVITQHTAPTNEELFSDPLAHTEALAQEIRTNPGVLLERIYSDLAQTDPRFVDNVDIRRQLYRCYHEAVRKHGAAGWCEDIIAIRSYWGFDLAQIAFERGLLICQPLHDTFTKPDNGQKLCAAIPGSILVPLPGGHFASFEATPQALAYLATGRMDYFLR